MYKQFVNALQYRYLITFGRVQYLVISDPMDGKEIQPVEDWMLQEFSDSVKFSVIKTVSPQGFTSLRNNISLRNHTDTKITNPRIAAT